MSPFSKVISFYFVLVLLVTIFSTSTAICQTNTDAGTQSETIGPSIRGRLIIKDDAVYIWFMKSHTKISAGRLLIVPEDELPPELSIEQYDQDPLTRAAFEAYLAWKKCEEAKGTPEEQRACAEYRLRNAEETLAWSTAVLENNPSTPDWVKEVNTEAINEVDKSRPEAYSAVLGNNLSDPEINTNNYILDTVPLSREEATAATPQ